MKLELEINEILAVRAILPAEEGFLEALLIEKIIKKCELTKEQYKEIAYKTTRDPAGNLSVTWNEEKAKGKRYLVEFTSEEEDLMKQSVDRLAKTKKISQDILPICKKIRGYKEEKTEK